MPTATSLSGYRFINNGPLTTTFTAPASCSTAYGIDIANASHPDTLLFEVCSDWEPPADCNPSGSSLVSEFSSEIVGSNPTAGMYMVYHSPGLICPSGWATVGGAAKLNPTSVSISGAFDVPFPPYSAPADSNPVYYEPALDAFIAALDPGETAAICCPSSYSTIVGGGCYSTLPRSVFTPTAGCALVLPYQDEGFVYGTWTFGSQIITASLDTLTATSPVWTMTTTFEASEATSYIGVAYQPMFVLVHQASDTVETSTPASTASTSKANGAVRTRGNGNGLGVVATGCVLGLVLGALLVL